MNYLKHYDGAVPGVKRKKSAERNAKQDYEKKRIRSFQDSWLKKFTWLRYDDNKGVMYCETCRSNVTPDDENLPFVKGTDNLKIDVVKLHGNSKVHLKYSDLVSAASKPASESGMFNKTEKS